MKRKIPCRLLNETEAAAYIGMSRSYLRKARMEGNRRNRTPAPKFIKIDRTVRYPLEELDQWLDKFHRLEHLGQQFELDL